MSESVVLVRTGGMAVSAETATVTAAHTENEVRDAIGRLTLADKTALMKVAKVYARRTRYDFEDLVQETFERVLSGRRKWPVDLPSVVFFAGVMRSIAWEWRDLPPPQEIDAADVDAPARNANSVIDAAKLVAAFADDPMAQKILVAMMDGARGEELQMLSTLGKTEYESKRTKIRRRIEKFFEAQT